MVNELKSNAMKNLWYFPGIGVFLGIFALSTFLSFPVQVEGVSYFDKVQHTFAYFVLSFCFLVAFHKTGVYNRRTAIILILSASVYGFSLELVQYTFFSYRYFEWLDALANISGVLIGFLVSKVVFRGK